jgi:hypothetical protein
MCLGISFNIQIGTLQIPHTKLQEVLSLCTIYISKSKITKTKLQALLGSLMFLHKAIKPARLFVNHIFALIRDMGPAASVAIDEGTCQDIRWFIACAHAANGTVSIYKCLQPQTDIFVDASLSGLGGALNAFVYRAPLSPRPGWSIAHLEAINVFVALQVFSAFIGGRRVMDWCDSRVAVAILHFFTPSLATSIYSRRPWTVTLSSLMFLGDSTLWRTSSPDGILPPVPRPLSFLSSTLPRFGAQSRPVPSS